MKRANVVRGFLTGMVIVTALVTAAGFGAAVLISLPPVQEQIRGRVERLFDALMLGDVSVKGMRLTGLGSMVVKTAVFRCSEAEGDSLIVNDLRLRFSPYALLRRAVRIESIAARSVDAHVTRTRSGIAFPLLPNPRREKRSRPGWTVDISEVWIGRLRGSYTDSAARLRATIREAGVRLDLSRRDSIGLGLAVQSGKLQSRWWTGDLDTLDAVAIVSRESLLLNRIFAEGSGLTVASRGTIPFSARGEWDLTVQAAAPVADLAAFRQAVPALDTVGRLQVAAALRGTHQRPLFRARLTARDVKLAGYAVDTLRLTARYDRQATLRTHAQLHCILGTATIDADLNVPRLLDSRPVKNYAVRMQAERVPVDKLRGLRMPSTLTDNVTAQLALRVVGNGLDERPRRAAVEATMKGGMFHDVPLRLDCSMDGNRWQVNGTWGGNTAAGEGDFAPDGSINGDVSVSFDHPEEISRLAVNQSIVGRVDGHIGISGTVSKPDLHATFASPELHWNGITADTVHAAVAWTNRSWSIGHAYGVIAGGLDSLLRPLGVEGCGGNVRAEIRASGTPGRMHAVAKVRGSDITCAGLVADTVSCVAEAREGGGIEWRNLRAVRGAAALTGRGTFTLDSSRMVATSAGLWLRHKHGWQKAGRATVRGTVGEKGLDLSFEARALELRGVAQLLVPGHEMSGRLTASGTLRGTLSRPRGSAAFRVARPGYRNLRTMGLDGRLTLADSVVNAKGAILLNDSQSTVSVNARVPVVSESGAWGVHGPPGRPLRISLRAPPTDLAAFNGFVDGQLTAAGGPAEMEMVLERGAGGWRVDGAVDVAGARFTYRPLGIVATGVSFETELGGDLLSPTARFRLTTGNVQLPSQSVASSVWEGELARDTISFTTGHALLAGGGTVRVTGRVPLREVHLLLSGGDPDLEFELSDVPLTVLEELIPGLRVRSGHVEGRGNLVLKHGSVNSEGTLRLQNCVFTYEGIGTSIGPVNGTIDLARDSLLFRKMEGKLGEGTFTLSGVMTLRPGGRRHWDIRLQAHEASAMLADLAVVRVKRADLRFSNRDGGYVLSGKVRLNETEVFRDIWVPGLIEMARGRNREAGVGHDFRRDLALDISLDLQRNLHVDMNLARARLDGAVVVSGTAARPGITGMVRVLEGDIFYLDRRFEITSGEMQFSDPQSVNPVFSIAATAEVVAITPNSVTEIPGTQNYIVTLNVNGTLDRPHVVLTSQPLLSESNIVGVLTLGTPLGAVGSDLAQRVQELAANQLLGLGARRLERLLGLDDIRVTAAPFGSQRERRTHLTLTKNLTRRLTVSYGTAIRAFEEREISAVFRLAKFLYLVGSTGREVPSSIDLKARLTW